MKLNGLIPTISLKSKRRIVRLKNANIGNCSLYSIRRYAMLRLCLRRRPARSAQVPRLCDEPRKQKGPRVAGVFNPGS
jgi:hypothetical protein